jgi:hypothetical protein
VRVLRSSVRGESLALEMTGAIMVENSSAGTNGPGLGIGPGLAIEVP